MSRAESKEAHLGRLPKTRTSTVGVWVLVAIPSAAILTCSILILVYQKSVFDVTIGLLLVLFCTAVGAGATLTLLGIRADRKLVALQVDFVSKVSHELKTPLTSIRLFVETLQMGRIKEPEKVQHCLEVINKEAERLSSLIGRLLSWGAMESGAFRVHLEPVGVDVLVRSAVEAVQPQAMSEEVEIEVEIDEDLPTVNADRSALIDAIVNLLSNALKYRGDSKKLEVSARTRADGKIAVIVKDQGIGIELRDLRRIFDRFYRADERYVRAIGGAGLGLAIAHHVVLAHGGSIEVESEVGAGSEFTIVLPNEATEVPETKSTETAGSS